MQNQDDDSSIEGELTDFLANHGVKKSSSSGKQSHGLSSDVIGTGSSSSGAKDDISDILSDDDSTEQRYESGEILMPACTKINKLLNRNGYKVSNISSEHIDMENRYYEYFNKSVQL